MITAMKYILTFFTLLLALSGCGSRDRSLDNDNRTLPSNMFEYSDNIESRWVSFENIKGEKGAGGIENNGAKGHACDSIRAGGTKVLLSMKGPGIINRIWVTISDRSPAMLRSLVLKMYWDNEEKPAVSVPFGDFFGIGLGKTAVYENAFFANPEGRSFNCFIQMPFKKAARVELVNESGTDLPMVFYDINLQLLKNWNESFLYFHSYWHRDTATVLARDFEIMPPVKGKGRFLGSNISINANPAYRDCIGSGTEDYIGTAWGQGQFFTKTTGCLIADSKNLQWAFYRFHISDPVYFKADCKVTIQQIGGNTKDIVIGLQKEKIRLIPVTIHDAPRMIHIYKKDSTVNLEDKTLPNAWTNFYRSDDLAATSYFYLDSPGNNLPDLQVLNIRTFNLKK
jgi:hypothetical protein